MAAKSPTLSLKSREVIGVDQFSQRREVFDKHDTVFLPLPSPTTLTPAYVEVEPIITSNHGKTTSNFKRNTPTYSSMRESKTDERNYDFRPRKYSDNFTSELNRSDDVDYRHTMTERTRRLSKMRRDFMTSNLHDPSDSPFARAGTRASMPVNSTSPTKYKIESPNLYKFPFAEPYTPTSVRKVYVDLGSPKEIDGKENQDPERSKYYSLPHKDTNNVSKIDHQKLFEELLKRYSPQRKPIDWNLPPTRPRIISSVPKSSSSVTDSVDSSTKKTFDDNRDKPVEDDVFEKIDKITDNGINTPQETSEIKTENENKPNIEIIHNGPESSEKKDSEDSKECDSAELEEKNDYVPELSTIQRQISKESTKRPPLETVPDISIPELIQKITNESDSLENNKKPKKVKRRRSFLDKLLGRNKEPKINK